MIWKKKSKVQTRKLKLETKVKSLSELTRYCFEQIGVKLDEDLRMIKRKKNRDYNFERMEIFTVNYNDK